MTDSRGCDHEGTKVETASNRLNGVADPEGATSRTIYDNKKYDIEYHVPLSDIENSSQNGSWLLNKGRVEFYPWTKMTNLYTYNEKNFYKYGSTQYVPSYEDSIHLSYKA